MRRGQQVTINTNKLSDTVAGMLSDYQKYNEATVSKFDKSSQRIQVRWHGEDPMWFNLDQVSKVN